MQSIFFFFWSKNAIHLDASLLSWPIQLALAVLTKKKTCNCRREWRWVTDGIEMERERERMGEVENTVRSFEFLKEKKN